MKIDPPDEPIEHISYFLKREERKQIFLELCKILSYLGCKSRARLVERISMETGIYKTHVYRYLNDKMTPNPKTTVKIIKALVKLGQIETVFKFLEPAAKRLYEDYRIFLKWGKYIKQKNIIYNPLSKKAIKEAESLLY